MLKRSAFAALVLAGFASGALAQSPPSQSWQPSGDFGARSASLAGTVYSNATQITLLRRSMNEDARSDVTLDQWRRAQKAVVLIKANRCEDAFNMALDEQDTRLAGNVAVVCKAHFRQ